MAVEAILSANLIARTQTITKTIIVAMSFERERERERERELCQKRAIGRGGMFFCK